MGLHPNWKAILKENYGQCFITTLDGVDTPPGVLIIDFLPFIFAKSKNITTGEHFLNYVFKTIRSFFDRGGHTCIIAIDNLKHVPLAKAPTQMDRDKYSKPLSKEELGVNEGKQVMGRGLLIHQEWHRVMANRDLREEIFKYFECEFLTNFFRKVKKDTWDHWMKTEARQQKNGESARPQREWLKSLIIDGGSRFGANPYMIYSSGKVIEKPEWRTYIGESDLKIPYYIHYVFPDDNFLVNSIDSDLIRVLLGGTHQRIDQVTGQLRSQIYLRLNDAKKSTASGEEEIASPNGNSSTSDGAHGQEKETKSTKRPRGRPKGSSSKGRAKDKAKAKSSSDAHALEEQPDTSTDGLNEQLEGDSSTQIGSSTSQSSDSSPDGKKDDGVQKDEFYYEPDFVDINGLWTAIREHWRTACPTISDPIANELVLMTLGGDDFVKNLPNCGAKVLHDVYIENAESIGPLVTVDDWSLDSVTQVDLHWEALWLLVRHVYKHKLKSHITTTDLPSYEDLRQLSIDCLKRAALHCVSSEEIEVKFRQVRWTLLYLINGYKMPQYEARGNEQLQGVVGLLIPDCLEQDADGRSLHGWTLKNPTEGKNRKNIQRATMVSQQTSYRLMVEIEDVLNELRKAEKATRVPQITSGPGATPTLSKVLEVAAFSLPFLLFAAGTLLRAYGRR